MVNGTSERIAVYFGGVSWILILLGWVLYCAGFPLNRNSWVKLLPPKKTPFVKPGDNVPLDAKTTQRFTPLADVYLHAFKVFYTADFKGLQVSEEKKEEDEEFRMMLFNVSKRLLMQISYLILVLAGLSQNSIDRLFLENIDRVVLVYRFLWSILEIIIQDEAEDVRITCAKNQVTLETVSSILDFICRLRFDEQYGKHFEEFLLADFFQDKFTTTELHDA